MGEILVGTPASIATPPAGQVTLFLNTLNNNILSYKDENGDVFIYSAGNGDEVMDCCACDIAKDLIGKIGCSLKDGIIDAAAFQAIVNAGISVVGNSPNDGNGNKTCNISISASNVPVTGVSVVPTVINPLAVLGQAVAVATITPANASNQTKIWSSDNVAVATVDQNGVITGVSAGLAIITVTTADGLFTATVTVTVI